MAVQKSGRTTGHTSGVVAAVSVTINVKYGSQCGGARGTGTFKNQIRVTPGSFSAGGDSGGSCRWCPWPRPPDPPTR